MFKNATIFKITGLRDRLVLGAALAHNQFDHCGPTQTKSIGWQPPREANGDMVEAVGGHWIVKLVVETKAVPAAAVKKLVAAKADKIEDETGRRPRGKRLKELKEEAVLELLPRAFPRQIVVHGWIDVAAGLLVIDSATPGRIDDFTLALIGAAEGVKLSALQSEVSPAAIMAAWLRDGEATSEFSLGRACSLTSMDGERAGVRYVNKSLDNDEVKGHIERGMAVDSLALSWKSRVDFTLTAGLVLAGIKILDVALETRAADVDAFDADIAIMTGELQLVINDLVMALGGEYQPF